MCVIVIYLLVWLLSLLTMLDVGDSVSFGTMSFVKVCRSVANLCNSDGQYRPGNITIQIITKYPSVIVLVMFCR